MPLGERIGQAYVKVILDGDDTDFKKFMQGRAKQLDKIGRDEGDRLGKSFRHGFDKEMGDGLLTDKDIDHIFALRRGRVEANAQKVANIFSDRFKRNVRNDLKDFGPEIADIVLRDMQKRAARGDAFGSVQRDLRRLEGLAADARVEVERLAAVAFDRDRGRSSLFLRLHREADLLGTAFGRGSRNNFLNFFGSLVRNVTKAGLLFAELGVKAVQMGKRFSTAFTEAGGGMAGFAQGVAATGFSLARLGPLLVAAGAGFAVLTLLIGPLVSLMSLLAGSVVALAGSLTFSLFAALGPLAGILTPLAVGFAFFGLQIATMTQKAKKAAKEAIQPLHKVLVGLSSIAGKEIFKGMKTELEGLAQNVKAAGVDKLFKVMGQSLNFFFKQLIAGTKTGVFKQFIADLTSFIPILSERLGTFVINVGAGLAGVFRAAIPVTKIFLDALVRVTDTFARFANSTRGQATLKKFFDDALESAMAVGGFIRQLGGLIKDMFQAGGKDAGDELFRSMGESIKTFRAFLKDNPDALKNWFRDSVALAKAVGRILVAFGKLAGALDNIIARKIAVGVINGLAGAIKALADALDGAGGNLVTLAAIAAVLERIARAKGKIAKIAPEAGAAAGEAGTAARVGVTAAEAGTAGAVAGRAWKVGFLRVLGEGLVVGSFFANLTKAFDDFGKAHGASWWGKLFQKPESLQPIKPEVDLTDVKLGIEQIKTLGTLLGLTPKQIKIAVDAQQAKDAKTVVSSLFSSLRQAFPPIKVDDKGSAKKTQKAIIDLISEVTGIPPAKVEVTVKGDKDAINRLHAVQVAAAAAAAAANLSKMFSARGSVQLFADGGIPQLAKFADGGFANFRQVIAGESGAEAIVPLARPLGQVDPSVRFLSAIAQGIVPVTANTGKQIDASGWTIVSNSDDPKTVAREVMAHIAAGAY